MPIRLKSAMAEILEGWQDDLSPAWHGALGPVELGLSDIDTSLTLNPWEPVFPVRRGLHFPGMPAGSHMLRAFDDIAPTDVRCVVLGQDPYPEPGFATGRAFEAGNLAGWGELDKMFSKSIRAYMQQIYSARTNQPDHSRSFDDWPSVRSALTDPANAFETPTGIADRWVGEGVLLLNTALTLSRFQVGIDPHQSGGHLPLWRPLMVRTLEVLAKQDRPLIVLAFGGSAADTIERAGLVASDTLFIERRAHPAFVDRLFAEPNPFVSANQFLKAKGLAPIAW